MNTEEVRSVTKFAEIKFNTSTIMMTTGDANMALILFNLKARMTRTNLWHKVKLYMSYDEFAQAVDKMLLDKLIVSKQVGGGVYYRVHLQHFRRAAHGAAFAEMKDNKLKGKSCLIRDGLI